MSTEKIAQGLASLGRNGDSVLVHMQPNEVAGLQAIAQANGTSLTKNPHTGMPEAFSLGGLFESLLPTAAGAAMTIGSGGAINPLTAGLITGALTTAMTGDLSKGIMGGFGAYGGAGLGESLSKAGGIGSEVSKQGTAMNEAFDMVKSGQAQPQAQAMAGGFDSSGMYNASLPSSADLQQTIGNINANGPMTGSWAENAATGTRNLFKPGGFDAFKAAGGSGMQLAMPVITGALGGLEESDIYGESVTDPNNVYDPYARLNLGGASSQGGSGLRLLAGGGPVSFAAGAMVGGGKGAMEGAGSYEIEMPQVQQTMANTNAQNRLLGGAWGDSARVAGLQYQNPMPQSAMSLMSNNARGQQAQAAPVKMGLFATQAQIDAAKNKAMSNRPMTNPRASYYGFGMYNNGNYGMGGWQNPNGFAGIGSIGRMPMGQQVDPNAVRPGSLNLNKLPASRLAAGGLAELQATSQGAQQQQPMQQQQPFRFDQQPAPLNQQPMQSSITTGGNMDIYGTSDANTQQISRNGFGLTNQPAIMQQHYAKGGELEEGAFIIPADVVSHLGNGSTDAGLAVLNKRYGAKPIRGAGDGMSDSIPTTIEGRQRARVADGEAYIPKAVVMKEGGAAKFHKMMDRIRKERTGSTKQGKKINPNKIV